jgi:hydroxypyruvate reductase
VYRAALARLQAGRLVREALDASPSAAAPAPLAAGPVRVLALGKAAGPMLAAALDRLGPRARDPLCVLPAGSPAPAGAQVIHAGHPRPDDGSRRAGEAALAWARAGGGAPALVLLSGGGSALASAPAPGAFTFEEKADALAAVMRAGASIQELNAVRKHLSALKGGRLGALLAPAEVQVLVLSDVPGDDLSTIASGPFVPDPTTWDDVLRIVDRLGVRERLPAAVRRFLDEAPARGDETPKPGDPRFSAVRHRLLAGPVELARAAAEAARAAGLDAEHDPRPISGDVAQAAARAAAWARARAGRGPALLAVGGEPTIRIPDGAARPDGGRAQHLALLAALAIEGLPAAVLAAGSDGRDGPTEQAGAVVDGETAAAAREAGVDLAAALAEARSGPAAVAVGAALPRFESGTHLCDLLLVAAR